MPYKRPTELELMNQVTLAQSIIGQQTPDKGSRRTTLSMAGTRQYNVSVQSMSDILQGTMSVRGPEETLLVVNKALSRDLDVLYREDYSSVSAFSTAPRAPIRTADGGDEGGGGGTHPQVGPLDPKYVAQIAAQVGFTETGEVPLWKMVAIAGRESKFDPGAINSATSDRGLWQINMDAHGNDMVAGGILTGGPFPEEREKAEGYPLWEPQLLDPITNAKAVYRIVYGKGGSPDGNMRHAWGAGIRDDGSFGWVGSEGDPLFHTDAAQAKKGVADAKAEGLLGKPYVPPVGTGGTGGLGWGNSGNTIEEIRFAQQKLLAHPNNWMATDGKEYASGWRKGLENGFTPNVMDGSNVNPSDYILFKENGKGFLFPSLINYLWHIMENGYILGYYLGSLGFKYIKGTSKVSNHSSGGAVDIGTIGLASERRAYPIASTEGRRVAEGMFNMLASMPSTSWADEHGWNWDVDFGTNGFSTHYDAGHIHIGFDESRPGSLNPALKKGKA